MAGPVLSKGQALDNGRPAEAARLRQARRHAYFWSNEARRRAAQSGRSLRRRRSGRQRPAQRPAPRLLPFRVAARRRQRERPARQRAPVVRAAGAREIDRAWSARRENPAAGRGRRRAGCRLRRSAGSGPPAGRNSRWHPGNRHARACASRRPASPAPSRRAHRRKAPRPGRRCRGRPSSGAARSAACNRASPAP